ncbi:hypothetical protein [Geitlerinema sp. PCC 7407]|uniref:hypothetical protein n=1 Tax=Geitlerinema sp. PCC 7407 TaxID=1173025 RepID=UPI00029F8FEF|nr:hypothetical protein [Geitlerinema sp. PCC 7407]AFY67430.1 hypothetical protein GEI7407_2960 [Geitlerinema sp. PCC 7407]
MVGTLATKNGGTPRTEAWLTASVQEFFQGINWDNQSQQIQDIKQAVRHGAVTSLDLSLPVSQFLGAIPWDGGAIAPPSAIADISFDDSSPASNLTLEDFSSLF